LIAACNTSGSTPAGSDSGGTTVTGPDPSQGTTGSTSAGSGATPPAEGCSPSEGGVAWRDDGSVTLAEIWAGDAVTIYAAEYPLPGETEGLWSQWGQGIALGDGRHLSAVGDHLGQDANSYFFVYDAGERTLTRFADVLSTVPHEEGAFGYGKVHAQMVRDACGSVWAGTYWGTREDLTYENGYEGDRLLEIDPNAMTIADRGPFAGEMGSPTMTITPDGRTLVAGSVDVEASDDTDRGLLTVYDTVARQTVEQVDDPRQEGFRALGIDPGSGRVFYSIGDNHLAALDPGSGEFEDLDVSMPGWWLRSVTRPAPDGTVYGAADDEPGLFSIASDGTLTDLGDPGGSTTSIAMTPDGSRIFWMPEAHGGAWEIGAPVMAMDTATGEVTEIASLLEPFEEELGLLPGGTYSAVYDEGRLILGVNASPLDDDSGFGTVVLTVLEGV
jgi:hypothetical protein